MPEPLSRDEFVGHVELIRGDLREVKEHLAELNDRTRKTESAIAVLEDRGHPAAWGGSIGAAVVGLVETLKWLVSK